MACLCHADATDQEILRGPFRSPFLFLYLSPQLSPSFTPFNSEVVFVTPFKFMTSLYILHFLPKLNHWFLSSFPFQHSISMKMITSSQILFLSSLLAFCSISFALGATSRLPDNEGMIYRTPQIKKRFC